MPGIATKLLRRPGYEDARRRFIRDLPRVLGATPVIGYLPHRDDLLTSVDPWSGRIWTADATMSGQITRVNGASRTFVAASSRYLTSPDTANASFGNGAADTPFSIVALINANDTAAAKSIVTKFTTSGSNEREYIFDVLASEVLRLLIFDDSAGVQATRNSDAAIPTGWHVVGTTSTAATGGATAANDITHYLDGVVIASTATNNAGYVAMEGKAAAVEIGSVTTHTANFMDGRVALVAVVARALTAADHAAVSALCRRDLGLVA